MTDYAQWLRHLSEKGGKGSVDNVDARSLGRAADEIAALRQENERLRKALSRYSEQKASGRYQFCGAWPGYGDMTPLCDCDSTTGCRVVPALVAGKGSE